MIIYYEISEEEAELFCLDGKFRKICFTEDTARVFYRVKFVNGVDEWHPGLFLGRDNLGIEYYLHNNLKTGNAEVVTRGEFSKGLEVCTDNRKCLGTPHRIVRMALARAVVGRPYRFRYYSSRNIASRSYGKGTDGMDKLIGLGLTFLAGIFISTMKQ